jgi:hypothetical protein
LSDLDFTHLQQREEHWAIVALCGKGGHIRTVSMPEWVKGSPTTGWLRPEFQPEDCSDVPVEQTNTEVTA